MMGGTRGRGRRGATTRRLLPIVMIAFALAGGAAPGARDIIDRVFAVVDGALITQSDVNAAIRLGLVRAATTADPVAGVLDALIERRLILAEVDRYAPPDPIESEVDRAFEAVRARVGAGAFDDVLLQTGGNPEQVRRFVRDDLRMDAYLQQRFGTIQPSELDVAQYYRDHSERFDGRGAQEAHDAVVADLATERRAALVGEWVAGLRRRANINVLPR
jgi:hypothetical protein